MPSRRKFLSALGIGAVAPHALFAKEDESRRSRWDMVFSRHDTAPSAFRPDPSTWSDNTITATWIGHATVLINFFGTTIITDPVLASRVGVTVMGLFTVGPKRLVEPALRFEDLPKIDLILLSHGHMDHMDLPTLSRFDRSTPVVLAKNTSDILDGVPFRSVTELDWGEKTNIGDLEIEAVQVKHFGWRYPWEEDRSKGNWNGRSFNAYLVSKNEKHVFFGGDTAYQEYFRSLGRRGIGIDLAIMPIGAYDPWIFNHANPEEALQMADHAGARHILPIHWGTFIQSDEPTMEPIERLKAALAVEPQRLALESIGQTWSMERVSVPVLNTAG